MHKYLKNPIYLLIAGILVLSAAGCTSSVVVPNASASAASRIVPVTHGSLPVNVSVDGNLVMPDAFNLAFGSPGNVKDLLVEEGDHVKAGAILATLDDTSQKLSVKSSNIGVQNTLATLYETVPRLPQFPTTFYDASVQHTSTGYITILDTTATPTITNTTLLTPPGTTDIPVGGTTITPTTTTTNTRAGDTVTTTTTISQTTTAIATTSVSYTGGNGSGPITITTIVTPTSGIPNSPTTTIIADGPTPVNTTTVNTSVSEVVTQNIDTTITTSLEKPRWDYTWDNTNNQWVEGTAPDGSNLTDKYLPYGYPGYYPSSTARFSYIWAYSELNNANYYFLTDNYTAASSELYIASADLESSVKIFEAAINDPESGLGNTAPLINDNNYLYFLSQDTTSNAASYIMTLRQVVKEIRQYQEEINNVRDLTLAGKYDEASPLYEALLTKLNEIGLSIRQNVNIIKLPNDTKVYGKDISEIFYTAADEKLSEALKGIETGGVNSAGLNDNLRIAVHYMQLCDAILGTNDYVLQHGLSLKAEQQAKMDLAKAMVDLGNKRDDFLKTVIMSPVDGIVVSVGVKKNDVLSQQDYSSSTIQVVDTTQIKFQGTVDEIDINQIKKGQKATISVDAISGKTFTGYVSFISPSGVANSSGVVKFNITILLDPTDVDLKGGLTSTAEIVVSTTEDTLMVPISAVTTTKDGSTVTIVDSTGKQEKVKVTTGKQNLQFVQILTGVKEGDKVVIVDTATKAPVNTRAFGPPGSGGGGPPGR
jgi:multidrug efflux pump subunit AcrA (membrane-fusion protein)